MHIVKMEDELARAVIQEYIEVLDTVEPAFSFFIACSYVPSLWDMAGAVPECTTESLVEIAVIMDQLQLFYRLSGEYRNSPFVEVW